MGWLDRLPELKNVGACTPTLALPKLTKPGFVGFDSAQVGKYFPTQSPETPARLWLLHFADQNPREVFRSPPATWGEMMADNPEAVAAEPMPDQVVYQGESRYCVTDAPEPQVPDDRHLCADCGNLAYGVCRVAAPGGQVSANRGYRPISTALVRCPGFVAREVARHD